MKKAPQFFLAAILALGTAGAGFAATADQVSRPVAANVNSSLEQRLYGEVHHQLALIPQFTIFDNLAYRVDGGTVTLYGQVRNAIIKDEAQSSIQHLEGVDRVINQIEILPASFNDDRIRRQVARAVFNDPRMANYAIQPVPPIHIIVKNGHVTLKGVVDNPMDKQLAVTRANSVPGVFSVQNNLQVERKG